MKTLLTATFISVIFCGFSQNEETKQHHDKITFLNTVINYDTIERYSDGNRTFNFYNTGNEPLVITRVKSGCSCTVAKYTKDTILPGGRGEITARYNTKKPGRFDRELTVYSNSGGKTITTKIGIIGFVLDTKKIYGIEKKKK